MTIQRAIGLMAAQPLSYPINKPFPHNTRWRMCALCIQILCKALFIHAHITKQVAANLSWVPFPATAVHLTVLKHLTLKHLSILVKGIVYQVHKRSTYTALLAR